MTDQRSTATPDVEVIDKPDTGKSVKSTEHDQQIGQDSADPVTSREKRKADDATDAGNSQGGKDLVETKQTTLDSIVQQETKEDAGAQHKAEERKVEEEKENSGDRPSKKAKTETTAATPPKQKSQTDAPGDRPHKSVKKVDDLKDKPAASTPTKSSQPDADVDMTASSPPPAEPTTTDEIAAAPAGKPGATTAPTAGRDDSATIPGDEEHLDHPENWTTGDDPATDKQKGFLKVLEKQKGVDMGDVDAIGKSEASDKIDKLVGTAGTAGTGTAQPAKPAASAPPAPAPPSATTGASGDDSSTVPGDEEHLDHPENWTTGGDPATDKQKGFLKVLEKQKGVSVGDVSGIGKSEASEKIDELKNM